ncbi:MAG: alpha/beta fold hydrolase [Alphaproteobacteria bacterium]|nr:alpha/beta fold hydrolase [Alphaproteobacteria bacterium]
MTDLITEDMTVPSEPGIDIFVRNKRPANLTAFTPERTLLFVHGSTYPAHTGFDIPLGGQSWMESIASHGYDVYCLDVRGYGRSTRPAAMDEPPQNNPPVTRTPDAVNDITAVLNFILKRRNIGKLNLLGWSWGCTLMATTAIANPDKVARLMLYAPGWLRTTPSPLGGPGPLGAYRTVTREQAKARWLNGVPEDKKAALIPPGWLEQWADATWATDPVGAKQNPPVVRAPNGTVADTQEFWSSGKTMYDPARITVPTLIAIGEWDQDTPPYMAQAIFPLMVNSPDKRLVMLAEGTHHMMLERNRAALFRAVQTFLDEANG